MITFITVTGSAIVGLIAFLIALPFIGTATFATAALIALLIGALVISVIIGAPIVLGGLAIAGISTLVVGGGIAGLVALVGGGGLIALLGGGGIIGLIALIIGGGAFLLGGEFLVGAIALIINLIYGLFGSAPPADAVAAMSGVLPDSLAAIPGIVINHSECTDTVCMAVVQLSQSFPEGMMEWIAQAISCIPV